MYFRVILIWRAEETKYINDKQNNKLKRYKFKIGDENVNYDCIISGILLHL